MKGLRNTLAAFGLALFFVSPAWDAPKTYVGELPPVPSDATLLSTQIGSCRSFAKLYYTRIYDTDNDPRTGAEVVSYGEYNMTTAEYGPPRILILYGPGADGKFTQAFVKVGATVKQYDGLVGRHELVNDYPNPCFALYNNQLFDA